MAAGWAKLPSSDAALIGPHQHRVTETVLILAIQSLRLIGRAVCCDVYITIAIVEGLHADETMQSLILHGTICCDAV